MKRRAFLRRSLIAAGAAVGATALPHHAVDAAVFRPAPQVPPELDVVVGDGGTVTLPGRAVRELGEALHGRVLLRGDEGYDDARRILNPSFDRHPALIVQVTGAADVATAVDFARDHGNLLPHRGGGLGHGRRVRAGGAPLRALRGQFPGGGCGVGRRTAGSETP